MQSALQRESEAAAIDRYVRSLDYDPRLLLSVQTDGATQSFPAEKERTAAGNAVTIVTKTRHSLTKNLSDVAILRPTSGVVFPGALVKADSSLAEGLPTPMGVDQGSLVISVDLPGLENGRRTVEKPTNSSVQQAITEMLEEWNQRTSPQGYINAARSFLEVKTIYSAQQVSLDLGFSAKWASGSASSQLQVSTDAKSSSVLAYYKQVFYSVAADTPSSPSAALGTDVTLDRLRQVVGPEHPPAYVRSVDYGRVLMIRMETSSQETKANLQGALKQVTSGGVEIEASVDAKFTSILKNATFTVVALGGGAQTAATFTGSEDDLKKLREYIAKDSTYRRDNPGAPVSYTVAFLKDNAIATMGFATDYTETSSVTYPNGYVRLKHDGVYVGKFEVTWEEADAKGNSVQKSWTSGEKTNGYTHQIDLPGDARNVRLRGWAATGLVWDPWGEALNEALNGPDNKCYRIFGTTLNRHWDNAC
jgi:thiol-activated cytolysin